MTWALMAVTLMASAILQMCLPPLAVLGQAKVPFLLAAVVYYALCHELHVALVAGLVAGFLQDALSPVPLGYSAFCFCVTAAVVGKFRGLMLTESVVTQSFFGLATGALVTFTLYVFLLRAELVHIPIARLMLKIVGTALLAMFVTPLMCLGLGSCDRLVGNLESKEEIHGFD